jgi:hypothetical protein
VCARPSPEQPARGAHPVRTIRRGLVAALAVAAFSSIATIREVSA